MVPCDRVNAFEVVAVQAFITTNIPDIRLLHGAGDRDGR